MNIGIILAAGNSTRFQNPIPKQLYPISNKPIINHSIDILSKCLDDVIIISNSDCSNKIITDRKILINDKDDRIESIKVGLDYLRNSKVTNILIHDAARPFIEENDINTLLQSQNQNIHSQFYLPIVNGLAKKTESGWTIPKREEHIQLCSPQITNFEIFSSFFEKSIYTRTECEILPIVSNLNMKYNLILGNYNRLRKITFFDDL